MKREVLIPLLTSPTVGLLHWIAFMAHSRVSRYKEYDGTLLEKKRQLQNEVQSSYEASLALIPPCCAPKTAETAFPVFLTQ